jgi:hypothetical protein
MHSKKLEFKCRNHNKKEGFTIGKIYNARMTPSKAFPHIKTFEVYSDELDTWMFFGEAVLGKYFYLNDCGNKINPFSKNNFDLN